MSTDVDTVKYPPSELFRCQIDTIERAMMDMETIPISEMELRHYFANGMYAREMLIPAGVLITGKIKKHEHISIISYGEVYEATEHGSQHISAPHTFVSAPNTKRLVYALTDCVWTTIHRTDETDLDKLEQDIIADDYLEFREVPV